MEKYKGVEPVGHYHDGYVLAVPTEHLESFLGALKSEVTLVGKNLGSNHPQEIEIHETFKPNSKVDIPETELEPEA